ncbi:MAG: Hpt domain-containing protein [Sulfuritalea sp.]|nr:Hpt domain-containing protein [Sulfuritalea sp.]
MLSHLNLNMQGAGVDYRYLDIERATGFIGDAQGVTDMLSVLCMTLKTDLPALQGLLHAHDVLAIQKSLHSLKGFLPIFSTQALADQLNSLERLAKAPETPDFPSQCAALLDAIAVLSQEAQNYLAQQAASPGT